MTRILLISGSTRTDSLHTAALRTAARFAPAGITATLYDGLRDLPSFVPGAPEPPLVVTGLRQMVAAADALLFCTPEYGGSLPGSLKNLLDWLGETGGLDDKPVAWLSVSPPGHEEGARAALEAVLVHGGARVLQPACIRLPLGPGSVGADGLVFDQRFQIAVLDVLEVLLRAPSRSRKAQPSWQTYSSVFPVVMRRSADPEVWRPPSS